MREQRDISHKAILQDRRQDFNIETLVSYLIFFYLFIYDMTMFSHMRHNYPVILFHMVRNFNKQSMKYK